MASNQTTGMAVRTGVKAGGMNLNHSKSQAARHSLLAIVPVAALLLAACQGGESPTEPTLSATVETASSNSTAPAGGADSHCYGTAQWTDRLNSAPARPAPTPPQCWRPRPNPRQTQVAWQ